MIDFAKIQIVADEKSFVGLKYNQDKLNLYLPKGCNAWGEWITDKQIGSSERYERAKEAFTLIFIVIQVFKKTSFHNSATKIKNASAIHGNQTSDAQQEFDNEDVPPQFYLELLPSLLTEFDNLAIAGLRHRLVRTERFDAKLASKQFDQALIDRNGVPFWPDMLQSKATIVVEPFELVQMYCWAFRDVQRQLHGKEAVIESEVHHLADQFALQHFPNNDVSLFDFETYELTRKTLIDRLELIKLNTAVQDDDFHLLYDTMHNFLYGGESKGKANTEVFGLNGFWMVWESMVLAKYIDSNNYQIAALDKSIIPQPLQQKIQHLKSSEDRNERSFSAVDSLAKAFEINVAGISKNLYPDLVYKHGLSIADLELNIKNSVEKKGLIEFKTNEASILDGDILKLEDIYNVFKNPEGKKSFRDGNAQDAFKIEISNSNNFDILIDEEVFKLNPSQLFILGRLYSSSFQNLNTVRTRYLIYQKLLFNQSSCTFSPEAFFTLGALWETYFTNINNFRNNNSNKQPDGVGYRKELAGYKYILENSKNNESETGKKIESFNTELRGLINCVGNKLKMFGLYYDSIKLTNYIIDAKYLNSDYFKLGNNETKADFKQRSDRKQHVYEFCLKTKVGDGVNVVSEYAIPGMCKDVNQCQGNDNLDELSGVVITTHKVQPHCVRCLMKNYAKRYQA